MDFKLDTQTINTLPYSAIQELLEARKLFAGLIELGLSENLRYEEDVNGFIFSMSDKENDYFFHLRSVIYQSQEQRLIYQVTRQPENRQILRQIATNLIYSKIEEVFKKWLEEITMLRSIKRRFLFPSGTFDDAQFEGYFANNDEDAAYNPFELDRQQVIFGFLTYAERIIQSDRTISEENRNDLLKEANELKENVAKLTKKRFVAALSKFAQKTKSVRNSLFNTIFDVLKKEMIKNAIFDGGSHVQNAIQAIQEWVKLLPHSLP